MSWRLGADPKQCHGDSVVHARCAQLCMEMQEGSSTASIFRCCARAISMSSTIVPSYDEGMTMPVKHTANKQAVNRRTQDIQGLPLSCSPSSEQDRPGSCEAPSQGSSAPSRTISKQATVPYSKSQQLHGMMLLEYQHRCDGQ